MKYSAVLENTIMQKGHPATAGSKMLENFVSPIDATIVTSLKSAGVNIVGRVETSEFGVSGLFRDALKGDIGACDIGARDIGACDAVARDIGTCDAVACVAVACVADGKIDFAFCNDYTGAISRAAALHGVCYIHPTYGTVSRYGLIPAVSSMDQIGVICKTPKDGFWVLQMISGYDSKDGVMQKGTRCNDDYTASYDHMRIKHLDPTSLELKYSDVYMQVMQILCCAELSNNISRYDGIKFGYRAKEYNGLRELYTKSRSEAFGEDVKLAAILGAMVLSHENYTRYYDKAMRIRRLIKDSLEFDKYDVIAEKQENGSSVSPKNLSPSSPENCSPALLTILSRLCGLPSLTTPEHVFIANTGHEAVLKAVCEDITGGVLDTKGGDAL